MSGDEGRGVAAIRSGEVPSNLRSGDVRMRKLTGKKFPLLRRYVGEQTVGSETSQYHEEKRPIGISLVAASESESSPNRRICQMAARKRSRPVNSRGCKTLLMCKT